MSSYGARPTPNFYPPVHESNAQPYRSDYSSTDRFASRDFVGQDSSGARPQDTYPPTRSDSEKELGGYEKGANPVTRGSIAAQVSSSGLMMSWASVEGARP